MANLDAAFNPSVFRKDMPMILATNRHLATLLPVRLAYDSGGYEAGRLLALNSVSGLFQKYANGGASGTGTAVGFLFAPISVDDFPSATGTAVERMVVGGELYNSKLVGVDGTATTQLGARVITDSSGTAIFKF